MTIKQTTHPEFRVEVRRNERWFVAHNGSGFRTLTDATMRAERLLAEDRRRGDRKPLFVRILTRDVTEWVTANADVTL